MAKRFATGSRGFHKTAKRTNPSNRYQPVRGGIRF